MSSAAVTDGWKVWAEYWEQNHIRAATPNTAAAVQVAGPLNGAIVPFDESKKGSESITSPAER